MHRPIDAPRPFCRQDRFELIRPGDHARGGWRVGERGRPAPAAHRPQASVARTRQTYYRKHISIDVLSRIAPLKPRWMMHAASGVIAGFIALALAFSLGAAVNLNLRERPIEYEMLGDNGSQHVCDATLAQLRQLDGVEVPTLFCGVRAVLNGAGIPAETPGAVFQLIVPFMFVVMGMRFLGIGIGAAIAVLQGEDALLRMDTEEHARLAAVHAAVAGDRTGVATPSPSPQPQSHAMHDLADKRDDGGQL
jgi:hypothetical protein